MADDGKIIRFDRGLTPVAGPVNTALGLVERAVDIYHGAGQASRWTARIAEQKRIAGEIEDALAKVGREPLDWPTRESMASHIIEFGGLEHAIQSAHNSFAHDAEKLLTAFQSALQEAANPFVHAERLKIQAAEQLRFVEHFQKAINEKLAHAARRSGELSPSTQVRESARLAHGIGERLERAAELMARASKLEGK
jgi:hypothetical protein